VNILFCSHKGAQGDAPLALDKGPRKRRFMGACIYLGDGSMWNALRMRSDMSFPSHCPFHLALPVDDLDAARAFYVDLLGCELGREDTGRWVDINLGGHQLSLHHQIQEAVAVTAHRVDGDAVPVRHFGLVLPMPAWRILADRLRRADVAFIIEPKVRFEGQIGEQATMFFRDPAGNALEFKSFSEPERLFASSD
jgi:extradiol dioxygenase family protein